MFFCDNRKNNSSKNKSITKAAVEAAIKKKSMLHNKLIRPNEQTTNNNYNTNNTNLKSSSDLFTTEFEINDVRISVRNILTKGQTHDEIAQFSGASISTRGRYISPAEKCRGAIHDRPLYLFIQGSTKKIVDLAVQKIEEIIQMETTQTHRISKFVNNGPQGGQHFQQQSNTSCVEKIMVGLDHAPQAFDLRGRLIGTGGANLHYIRNETGAMATLRGRGSLFIDPNLGQESLEPMHLYIEHLRYDGLQAAKQLAKNLIETLQQELVQFQQMNPPIPNIQYSTQGTVMQQSQQVFSQQTVAQMGVPPPMLAVPPPIVQTNNIVQQAPTILQSQGFIQQNHQTVGQQSQPTQQQSIIQQQTLIPQSVPIQLHQAGNMMIQQQVQSAPAISNVNLPPPGVHIPLKTGPLVQLQGPPPPSHLSQPPPNIQLQQQPQTQIVLNQAPPNYQYQYIQQAPQMQSNDTQGQPNQVTIQHIYQPQQQIQGIIQQNAAPQHFEHFQQQIIRPQQIHTTQQYITLQGNATYMVPPPNMVHSTQHTQQSSPNHNIIFSTQQPQQIQQLPPQIQSQQEIANLNGGQIIMQHHPNSSHPPNSEETVNIKIEAKSPEQDDSSSKGDFKSDDNQSNHQNGSEIQSTQQLIHNRPPNQPIVTTMTTIAMAQAPPPIMTVPPPMCSGVQHIMGNTYITTQPPQQQSQQIFNQVPVSIHQIQHQPQQIQVPAGTQHHFLVNHPWQPPQTQIQQLSHNNQLQNVQIAHQIRNPNEITIGNQTILGGPNDYRGNIQPQQQHHPIMTTSFNPQIQSMQVQFQPVPPPQIMTQIQSNQPIFDPSQQQQQQIINSALPPPPFNAIQSQQIVEIGNQSNKINGPGITYQPGNSPQPVPFPQQPVNNLKQNNNGDTPRAGQKRKLEDDESTGPNPPPRMGMGSNNGGNFIINQRDSSTQRLGVGDHHPPPPISSNSSSTTTTTSPTASSSTTHAADENATDKANNNGTGNKNKALQSGPTMVASPPTSSVSISDQQQHQQSPIYTESRPFYQRDSMENYNENGGGPVGGFENSLGNNGPPPPPPPRGPRPMFHPFRPSYMQDNNYSPLHRCNMMPPPPPPQFPHRDGGYGPPPRFRNQW